MPAFNKYQCFVQDVGRKVHNLHTDSLKLAFTNTAPNAATHAVLADITEIAPGNGYSAGGLAIVAGQSYAQTGGIGKLLGNDPLLTASGVVGPFRYVVLYNATAAGGPLVGYWDRGASLTLQNGEAYTPDLDQAAGILTIT